MITDIDRFSETGLMMTSDAYPSIPEALDAAAGVKVIPGCVVAFVTEDARVVSIHHAGGLNEQTPLSKGQKLIRFPAHEKLVKEKATT